MGSEMCIRDRRAPARWTAAITTLAGARWTAAINTWAGVLLEITTRAGARPLDGGDYHSAGARPLDGGDYHSGGRPPDGGDYHSGGRPPARLAVPVFPIFLVKIRFFIVKKNVNKNRFFKPRKKPGKSPGKPRKITGNIHV